MNYKVFTTESNTKHLIKAQKLDSSDCGIKTGMLPFKTHIISNIIYTLMITKSTKYINLVDSFTFYTHSHNP